MHNLNSYKTNFSDDEDADHIVVVGTLQQVVDFLKQEEYKYHVLKSIENQGPVELLGGSPSA